MNASGTAVSRRANSAEFQPAPFYHPELDVLRCVAFLLVFLYHAIPWAIRPFRKARISEVVARPLWGLVHGGAYGVDVFFVLSSFLITELLLREHERFGTINISAFYARRILRIWPLYIVFLLCSALIIPKVDASEELSLGYVVAFALFAGNWACAFWGFPESVAAPLWSVSVEEQFYIAWPIIVNRWKEHLPQIAAGLFVIAFSTRSYLVWSQARHPAVWCNTFAHLDSIGGGVLLAWFLHNREHRMGKPLRTALIAIAFALIATVGRYCDYAGPTVLIGYPAAVLAGVLLVYAVFHSAGNQLGSLTYRGSAYLGRISYGLYVFHIAALHFTHVHTRSPIRWALGISGAFLVTVALASVSYAILEKPFLKLKRRFTFVQSIAT